MKPYSQPRELMCIECGALRPTLRVPDFRCDTVTRTLGPLVLLAFAILRNQQPHIFERNI